MLDHKTCPIFHEAQLKAEAGSKNSGYVSQFKTFSRIFSVLSFFCSSLGLRRHVSEGSILPLFFGSLRILHTASAESHCSRSSLSSLLFFGWKMEGFHRFLANHTSHFPSLRRKEKASRTEKTSVWPCVVCPQPWPSSATS